MKKPIIPTRQLILVVTAIIIAAAAWRLLKRIPMHFKKAAQHTSEYMQPLLRATQEQTLAIIKPDAVQAGHTGEIIKYIELNKFIITHMLKTHLSKDQAQRFYQVHKDKPFYPELVQYMISGPIVIMVLEKEGAVADWRALMGATNPAQAAPGTIRKMFGTSVTHNAAHGSDSAENAHKEIVFFFSK